MKQILHQEILEFVYDSKEERDEHVKLMVSDGWENGSRVKKLKANVSILDAKPNDYEWFADFWKYY